MKRQIETILKRAGDRRKDLNPPRGKSPKTIEHKLVRAKMRANLQKLLAQNTA